MSLRTRRKLLRLSTLSSSESVGGFGFFHLSFARLLALSSRLLSPLRMRGTLIVLPRVNEGG